MATLAREHELMPAGATTFRADQSRGGGADVITSLGRYVPRHAGGCESGVGFSATSVSVMCGCCGGGPTMWSTGASVDDHGARLQRSCYLWAYLAQCGIGFCLLLAVAGMALLRTFTNELPPG